MVVARKTPAAPAPPASRSTSSQPLPRAAKQKATPVVRPSESKPTKSKSKPALVKVKPKPADASFSRRLVLLLLSVLSVYALTVCRTDFPRTSPVCKSLDAYRTHILDPYVVPPLQSLLHHTEPHLAPLKPYATSTITFTRTHIIPPASAAISFTRTRIIPPASTALSFIVAQYNVHVAPRVRWFFIDQYWNGIIKPIYFKGPHPFLEAQTRPYRIFYHRFVVPFARKTAAQAQVWYTRTRPHAVAYLKLARLQACNAYKAAKPHALAAYARVRPHLVFALDRAKVQALLVARKAGEARREFVDPHVRRIWEKVGEAEVVSSSSESVVPVTSTATPTQASADEPTPMATPPDDAASASSVILESAHAHSSVLASASASASVAESEPKPTLEEAPTSTPTAMSTAIATPSSSSDAASSSSSQEAAAVTSSQEAVIPPPSVPAPASESPIPTTELAAESAASVVAASLHASATSLSSDSDEVDDFLKDIGLDSEGQPDSASNTDSQTSSDADTQAQAYGDAEPSPEERLRLTAEKRADITGRHVRWQAELVALVDEHTSNVKGVLGDLRKKAARELKGWGETQKGKGKGVLADIEEEAERLVRGLEGYLRGVEERVKGNGKEDEPGRATERQKWDKVLEKVEERFRDKVRDVQREVHEWFVGKRAEEIDEVNAAAATVKAFAERAQTDIGLDYAWLDDVTYHDWQKYHDLMRTSENFTTLANALQAAVDPRGTNVLVDALNDLEEEVNEVVHGFGVLLSGVRRRAEGPGGVFSLDWATKGEEEHETKENNEENEEKEGEGDERVSILPIEPQPTGETETKAGGAIGVEDVLLGRSKEEVEAKLADVPVESEAAAARARATREEL
ncbi:hypothetical protein D9615_003765 [Tricholomella constricta]|uniref:Uncharacterized protein n=1 Tax=Tricholomella constricta TaxID=117010 RepID=A0A8H5HHP7_9AGAR|nr:hypothetical protein D9615_003765 [Tricholomella constricta]